MSKKKEQLEGAFVRAPDFRDSGHYIVMVAGRKFFVYKNNSSGGGLERGDWAVDDRHNPEPSRWGTFGYLGRTKEEAATALARLAPRLVRPLS